MTYCYRFGIEVDIAPGTLVELSQIGGTVATTNYTIGIFILGGGGTVTGNVINTVNPPDGGSGNSHAILVGGVAS